MDHVLTRGIIVGLNAKIEYLLPLFYLSLRLHTDLPITFFDFGMSIMGKTFCEKRGQVLPVDESIYAPKSDLSKEFKRQAWFKKPLAFKQAPYDLNLWLDLDCLIREDVTSLFEYLKDDKWLAAYKEFDIFVQHKALNTDQIPVYNSGVVAFKKESPFIEKWINLSHSLDLEHTGDQDVLSFCLFGHEDKIALLDARYNFFPAAINPDPNLVCSQLTSLDAHPSLKALELKPEDAHIIHFVADLKNLLLARYQVLESLTKKENKPRYTMYQDYLNHKIILYYTPDQKKFLGWAKSFWLMKTPHPVITCEIDEEAKKTSFEEPMKWINRFCKEHKQTTGIFVPVVTRILVELDFHDDSHKNNRFSLLKSGLPIICLMNPQDAKFDHVTIEDVFEDLSLDENRSMIEEEILLIKEKLLLNI